MLEELKEELRIKGLSLDNIKCARIVHDGIGDETEEVTLVVNHGEGYKKIFLDFLKENKYQIFYGFIWLKCGSWVEILDTDDGLMYFVHKTPPIPKHINV